MVLLHSKIIKLFLYVQSRFHDAFKLQRRRAGAPLRCIILGSASHRLYENDTHLPMVSSTGDTRVGWPIAFLRGWLVSEENMFTSTYLPFVKIPKPNET
jgi:hypothetical protein